MSLIGQNFMSKNDLKYFNDTVNNRLRWRLKYKGEFALTEDQSNWNDLAPSEEGHLWCLSGLNTDKVEIGGETFKAGDWIIAINRTRKTDDGQVVDDSGNPTEVVVRKLIDNKIADGEDNGDALVYANGAWTIQKNYGWYESGATSFEYDATVNPSGIVVLEDFNGFVPGNSYTITIGDETETVIATDQNQITFNTISKWTQILKNYGRYWLICSNVGEVTGRDFHIVIEGEQFGEFHTFDPRYIDPASLIEMPGVSAWEDGVQENTMYKTVENVYEFIDTLKLTDTAAALYIPLVDGLHNIDGTLYMSWKKVARKWYEGTSDLFEPDEDGRIWLYRYDEELTLAYTYGEEPSHPEKVTIWTVHFSPEGVPELHVLYCSIKHEEEEIEEQHDNGDAKVWYDNKWSIMNDYGYKAEDTLFGPVNITFEDNDGSSVASVAISTPIVPGETCEFLFDDTKLYGTFSMSVAGRPTVTFDDTSDYVSAVYEESDSKLYITSIPALLGETKSFSMNKISYSEFDRRYIPAPVRFIDNYEDIPVERDDSYRTGDLFYVLNDSRNISFRRYSLSQSAIDAGWERGPAGIMDHADHMYTWSQMGANDDVVRSQLLTMDDDGSIYRASLANGIVLYGRYFDGMTLEFFSDRKVLAYNRANDKFAILKSEQADMDTHIAIETGFVIDLPDNLYNE